MATITKFRVFSRVRPFIETELEGKTSGEILSVIEMVGNRTVLLDPKEGYQPKAQFEFDDSLWSIPDDYKMQHVYEQSQGKKDFATQRYVYNLIAKDCHTNAFDGINTTIMSYGQTGSGKTYTMMGKYDSQKVCGGDGDEGIIPRVCHDVFQHVEEQRKVEAKKPESERRELTVEVTFIEIYNEKVRDLLDRANATRKERKEAKIRLDPATGPYVEGLTKYRVSSWAQCCKLLEQGSTQRTTGVNAVHEESSRSHAIFTVTVVQRRKIPPKDKYAQETYETLSGRINLVDLAGAERGGYTDYVKESSNINKSLLSLRRVIDALVDRQRIQLEKAKLAITEGNGTSGGPAPTSVADSEGPTVPFRDSVLTWLLSESMGGNSMTTMIAAVSPHAKNFGDTSATLHWSTKARNLVGVVRVNDGQANVESGMLGRRSDLQSSIHQQRMTVDHLQQEIERRKKLAAELEKKTFNMKREYIDALGKKDEVSVLAAALTLQFKFRGWLHNSRVKSLLKQLDDINARLQEKTERIASLDAALVGINAEIATKTTAVEAQRAEVKALESKVQEYVDNQAQFEKEYAEALELNKAGENSVEELRIELGKKGDQIVKEHEEAKIELEQAHERYDADQQRLESLQAEVNAFTEEEEQALRAEAQQLEAANKKREDDILAPLRQRNQELTAEKDDLQEKIDAKKKKK